MGYNNYGQLMSHRFYQQLNEQFEKLLHIVDIVSFDLFDTLVQREGFFSPKDLFYRVQDETEKQLGLNLDNFISLRIRAEEIARTQAWGRGLEETTLVEIYAQLGRMARLGEVMLPALQKIELDCERIALAAREEGRQLYQTALAAGKTVIITSDTYFDESFITEILKQTGYGPIQKIYLSSVWGKTKLEGNLYNLALKEMRCAPNRILHVGDNQLSDVTMALNKGLRSLHLPSSRQWFKWRCGVGDSPSGNLEFSAMLYEVSKQSLKENKTQELPSVLTRTAVENLSLLYYGFSAWLLAQLRQEGYRRVYFAARDGLIMKRFFDLTAAAAGFEIDSRYLYVSRAALYPSLVFTEPETARRLFSRIWDRLTIEEALRRISLSYDEVSDLLVSYDLAGRKRRLDGSTATNFSTFLSEVWPLLERKHQERYELIIDYLRQEMVLTGEKAAFVDIGWHGSLQACLVKLLDHLDIAKDFHGYYLGTFEKPNIDSANFKASGFLVNNEDPHWISELVRFGPSVIELFHSAGHGSVLGYKREGAKVAPILEDNFAEQEQYQKIIEPIQDTAFQFVSEQLERRLGGKVQAPEPGVVARTALRVVYAPTAAEAATFGQLKIASDFGGRMKSITGTLEWDLKKVQGEFLPDGTVPIWRPGFQALRQS